MTDEVPKGGDSKEKTKDDKVAVATSGAAIVVIVLFVIWGIYFFKSIASGTQRVQLGGGFGDQLTPSNAVDAQKQLENTYSNSAASDEELKQIHSNASGGTSATMDLQQTTTGVTPTPFGTAGQ
jgi:sRNA-binding protein